MLPKPLIVECKDIEEGSRLRKNLLAGWRKVAKRLKFQAEQGWMGNYAPWRCACTYVYAVSARLPPAQMRVDLRNEIGTFFSTLPGGPPLDRIEVLDWSDLRALWDDAPRLADLWLGVGLETLLGHGEQIERFTGFRSYLLEAQLPFVSPPISDPSHPDALLARLSEPGRERGLLLEGPGGVGKSRTLVEVAVRADASGWRVLHAQAGEPALADADLEATVLTGSGPTLVVFDYLDQMQLDLTRLRQRLLPAATARGIRLSLLANARPGSEGQSAACRDLFDVVPIRPTDQHSRAITDRLLATVAPYALENLGRDRLAELCGLRPIIALFIAREVERRAVAGTLTGEQLAGIRSGDLTRWLRRRLAESDLAVPPAPSRLEPASPSPHLVAAATILAATPQSEVALALVGERALSAAGLKSPADLSERSRWLIAVLREMGWLEVRDGDVAAAHDVVADEVTHDLLADRSSALVRTTELEMLLAPAFDSARTLGRFAISLRRVLGMEGIAQSVAAGLAEASAAWLIREATSLGQFFSLADEAEVAYALGAVIHGEPWAEAAFAAWGALIAPFLAARAERPAARHLLYRGLSNLPEGRNHLLLPVAFRWIERNGHLLEGSFVLAPLLGRADLETHEAQDAVAKALAWLETFGAQAEAQFVLAPLLGRADLEIREAQNAVAKALVWLETFGAQAEAQFVLHSLLGRADLEIREAQNAVAKALVWLETFGAQAEAGFVLRSLLGRADLETREAKNAVAKALVWLETFGAQAEAQFVLAPLLGRTDLEIREAQNAVAKALAWLETFGAQVEAGFVLAPLLGRTDLEIREAKNSVAKALAWLETFGAQVEAGFVLAPLLGRADLKPRQARLAVKHAIKWLNDIREGVGKDFVLKSLLSRNDLSEEDLLETQLLAADWVGAHPLEANASFLLKQLLSRKNLEAKVAQVAVDSGLIWFESNTTHLQADFVFSRLLRRPELGNEQRLRVSKLGIEWLRRAPFRDDRDFALGSLLWNAGLLDETDRQFLAHDTSDWLTLAPRNEDIVWRLKKALRRTAGEHPEESWIADLEVLVRPTAVPEFFSLSQELASQAQDSENVPTVDGLTSAIHQVELQLHGEHPASAGYALKCLLPLAARVAEQEIGERVLGLTERFLKEPTLTLKNLLGFASACYRYLDEGAWPDSEAGERVLASLGIERPLTPSSTGLDAPDLRILEKEAVRLAASANPLPSPGWLDLVLAETAKPIENGFPKASGFLFPPLLPLTARFGSVTTREALKRQICALLDDPLFSENGLKRFSQACYRFVDEGAWPDREEAERVLVSLGIERPAP
jgi:hypothetical protein